MAQTSTEELKRLSLGRGADAVGVADLAPFKSRGFKTHPNGLLRPFSAAVSIAIAVEKNTILGIGDRPTPQYADQYRQINGRLDSITAFIRDWIRERGYDAVDIPASFKVGGELMGNVSHKAVARMAGIGWQGKSLLIVNERFGPAIRLSSVLTDMPLETDRPVRNRCGNCKKCATACPAGAIKNIPAEADGGYNDRSDAINLMRCYERTLENKGLQGIGASICGVCIKACPYFNRPHGRAQKQHR